MDPIEELKKNIFSKPAQSEKKFFIFFLWTSLVPLILLFTAGYYVTANLLEDQAFARQTALAEQRHSELALFVEKIQAKTASWGTDGRIRELSQKINDGACSKAKSLSTCPTALELSEYLATNKIPLDPSVGIIDILNTSGIVVASSDTTRIGLDESEQKTSFEKTKALPFGQATYFPELVTEEEEFNGRLMVHLSTPVASPDNKRLVGILLAHTENKELNDVVAENLGQTTESYIVNANKRMVTPSRFIPEAVLNVEVNSRPVSDCTDHGLSFKGSYKDYRNVQVFGASICDPELFGTLIVETDKDEVFIEINNLRNTAVAILLVVLIIILGYAYLSGADIVRGAKHIFPSKLSSAITLIVVIGIIIIATVGISFIFTENIKNFITSQKTSIISSLVAQQADRHLNHSETVSFLTWETPDSQKKFKDFADEVLRSFQAVVAVQLHTPSGVLAWSSLQNAPIGSSPEAFEVSEALRTGEVAMSASTSTKAALGSTSLIGLYIPILGKDRNIVGVAETYIDSEDITLFTENLKTVLWIGAFLSLVLIFLLLRFVFRQQDAKIIAQAAELGSLIEQSPIGIFTINNDGIVTSINPKMLSLIEAKTADEITGRTIFDIKRVQRMNIIESIKEALLGAPFEREVTAIEADGNKIYRYYRGTPLFADDNKTVLQVLFIVEDITERKHLEQQLGEYTKDLESRVSERTRDIAEARAKAEALLASLGEGMIATDNDGKIITMNRTAEKILKWDTADALGKKITDVVPAVDENGVEIPEERRVCLKAAGKGSVTSLTDKIYFIKKSGDRVAVAVTSTPVIINGENTGAVVIFRDITAENEIEKTRRDLLSLASHQLRTPLSGTKWLIETLRKGIHGTLSKSQEEYLDEIYKINERMTTLVHDMLGVLRMEGDITPAKNESVSTSILFDVLYGQLGGAAKSKNINLLMERSEEYTIVTDALLLQHVLESLISNGINYSPEGSEVVVSVKRTPEEFVFAVRDSGIGIPKEEQRQIFERFYRASNAKTYDTHGTGLGLYIASMLAKKIGATLSFESEKNKGATFFVNIPCQNQRN